MISSYFVIITTQPLDTLFDKSFEEKKEKESKDI